MTAIEALIAGLFDYAGLYPPASLGLRSAANNYLEYSRSARASALGRFIVNLDRLDELRSIVGDSLGKFRISVILNSDVDALDGVAEGIRNGIPIETLEIKCAHLEDIERLRPKIPAPLMSYFEVPVGSAGRAALQAVSGAGGRAKIRMGGVVPEAFPPVLETVQMLAALATLRLPFKATAGLHHPVRSCRDLTYQPHGPRGTMHGFMNLCCAAAVLYYGGDAGDARKLLEEEDPSAWQIGRDAIQWRHLKWSTDQLATMRHEFFESIGSCSFEEPMHDLESLAWL